MVYLLETIEVYDINVGVYSKVNKCTVSNRKQE